MSVLLTCLTVLSALATIASANSLQDIAINGTTYQGLYDSTADITTFKSIRYGKAPTGKRKSKFDQEIPSDQTNFLRQFEV